MQERLRPFAPAPFESTMCGPVPSIAHTHEESCVRYSGAGGLAGTSPLCCQDPCNERKIAEKLNGNQRQPPFRQRHLRADCPLWKPCATVASPAAAARRVTHREVFHNCGKMWKAQLFRSAWTRIALEAAFAGEAGKVPV